MAAPAWAAPPWAMPFWTASEPSYGGAGAAGHTGASPFARKRNQNISHGPCRCTGQSFCASGRGEALCEERPKKQPLSPLRLVAVISEQNSFDKSILVFYTKIPASMPTAWREYKKDRKYIVMLTLDKIYHAAFVLKDVARRTDLIEAPRLHCDCQLYLKPKTCRSPAALRSGALTIRSVSFPRRSAPRVSSPALRAITPRAWRWQPPAAASKALSACRTAPL